MTHFATHEAPPRVLVVDDEEMQRILARTSLEQAGFIVDEAADGAQALDRFAESNPDLVLLDVRMPVLDGFDTCRAIRESSEGRHIPILMLTGLDDVDSIDKAYRSGATDFAVKPINWLIIGHRLSYMLRASRDAEDAGNSPHYGESVPTPSDAILIIGFGPAGQRVAEGLIDPHQGRIVVVDLNPENIAIANRYGLKGILGDATQTEILEHAGIYRARVVVLVLPDHNTTRQLIYHVRDLSPDAHLIVRCRYHVRHWELLNAGAHEVADEEDQVGQQLAERVQQVVSVDPAQERQRG